MGSSEYIPQIRIEKIHLENFKGVNNGVVEFNCLKNPFERSTQADILGLYGQNGSGKTTLLEALHIASIVLSGESICYADFFDVTSQNASFSRIELSFQVINPDETIYHVEYAFSMKIDDIPHYMKEEEFMSECKKNIPPLEIFPTTETGGYHDANTGYIATVTQAMRDCYHIENGMVYLGDDKVVLIYDEVLRLSGRFNGEDYRYGPIFDSSSEEEVFVPKAKHAAIFPIQTSSIMEKLAEIKKQTMSESRSFLFSDEVSQIIKEQYEQGAKSALAELIWQLKGHVISNIRVMDSRVIYTESEKSSIEFITQKTRISVSLSHGQTILSKDEVDSLKHCLEGLNIILNQIIPGLSLEVNSKRLPTDTIKGGVLVHVDPEEWDVTHPNERLWDTMVYSVRKDVRIPLCEESKGIIHLITMLGLFSFAFSNPSATVAIDEIDAGVYEYLLGELLLIFEEYGCGQLIFTCHNLRPMEVINKKFVCFTTTNPNNRYIKPKSIRNENNLRDVYLREIILGGQEEELYSATKHSTIASALQKAGESDG